MTADGPLNPVSDGGDRTEDRRVAPSAAVAVVAQQALQFPNVVIVGAHQRRSLVTLEKENIYDSEKISHEKWTKSFYDKRTFL